MGWNFYNSSGEALVQHAESEATKAEMEAETAGSKFVPPDLIKHSPGVAKAWCEIGVTGVLSSPSYNIASVGDTGVGDWDINYTTAFSSAVYSAGGALGGNSSNTAISMRFSKATADCQFRNNDPEANSADDDNVKSFWAFGDQ